MWRNRRGQAYFRHPVLQVVGHVLFDGARLSGSHLAGLVSLEQSTVQGDGACDFDAGHRGALRLLCIVFDVLRNHREYGVSADKVRLCRPALRIGTVEIAQEDVDGIRAVAAELITDDVGDVLATLWWSVLSNSVTLTQTRFRLRHIEVEEPLRK